MTRVFDGLLADCQCGNFDPEQAERVAQARVAPLVALLRRAQPYVEGGYPYSVVEREGLAGDIRAALQTYQDTR